MPNCKKTTIESPITAIAVPQTADADEMCRRGTSRLPMMTADPGRIRLGGGYRLPCGSSGDSGLK